MKIVKEILYENNMKFIENEYDPISGMKIGIETAINKWLISMGINEYRLTKKREINVYDTIILENKNIEMLPEYIKFNHIMGGFHAKNNNLISLKGFPYSISGSFMLSRNKLKNLKFGPSIVKEIYSISYNEVESLEGIAKVIGDSIYLNNNNLTNLKYLPEIINGTLNIQENPIISLIGFPKKVLGDLFFTETDFLTKEKIKNICQVNGNIINISTKK